MIPLFPTFKKLELSDRTDVRAILSAFQVYSDYDFESLWSWDVKEEIEISQLNENLVVKFTDYVTGVPFMSFIGTTGPAATAQKLLEYSIEKGYGNQLHMVPEVTAQMLDGTAFDVAESRDHFDYICELERYVTYSGGSLKAKRNFLNSFKKHYPDYTVEKLELSAPGVKEEITDLYRAWEENKGFLSQSEAFAYERFLDAAPHFEYAALGIRVDGKLVGFHVSTLTHTDTANGLFQKADITYPGAYAALMHEVAKDHIARGYTHLNYEQDLGVENLRKSKLAFEPVKFLRKYSVTTKGAAPTSVSVG